LQVTLDGQPFTAPLTVTSVEGMLRTIGAPSPQGIYSFSNWSQGGTATQTFATPVEDVTYTANFNAGTIITLNPIADAYVNGGKMQTTILAQLHHLLIKQIHRQIKVMKHF
jgi:hypothetical protein